MAIFVIMTSVFRYLWIYDRDKVNMIGLCTTYSLFLALSVIIISTTETQVLELDNTNKLMKCTVKQLLTNRYIKNISLSYRDISKIILCQKVVQRTHSVDIRYYLKINLIDETNSTNILKLFKTSSLYNAKKHYYLLSYLLDKEMVLDDTQIPIELITKSVEESNRL